MWFFLTLVFIQLATKSYLSYQDNYISIKNQSANINILMSAQVANLFEKMEYTLDFIKSIIEKENIWEKNRIETYLRKFQSNHPEIQTLKIFDHKGNYFADTLPELSKANVTDREYFQVHFNNPNEKFLISGPLISKSTGKHIIVFSTRLNHKDGSFKGLAVITLEITYFKKLFASATIGKEGIISLFYKGSTLVARIPWQDEIIAKKFHTSEKDRQLLANNQNEGSFVSVSQIDHTKRFYNYKKIGDSPFMLFAGLSFNEYLSDWRRSSATDFTFFIFIVIVSHFITIIYCLSLEKIEFQKMNIFRTAKMTTLGEMSSQLAHEINNPLTIIRSSAHSLKKIFSNDNIDRERALNYLAKIENTTIRITKIIAGLRAFSRSGDNDPFEAHFISKLLQDVVALCSHRLKMASVELKILPYSDFSFECRASQIEQVFLNLLNNSIDSISELSEKWIQIEVNFHETYFILKFSDSGSGIPPQIAERIMEPFYTTKAVGQGTGLGLSIAKGLIESHRGKLWYNPLAKNTEFVIELPVHHSK